ncbi:MAG: diguanylate cyclase [Bryobacterales bacterium]|nr:diguanylate cyclase [Bryobacterales bacterium]
MASFLAAVIPFESNDPIRYAAFVVAAMLTSGGLRVSLPSVQGTLSINFIFVLIGIIALSAGETMVLTCLVTAIQLFWRPARRPTGLQIGFNLANAALAVAGAQGVYNYWRFPDMSVDQPLRLLFAASVFFVLNSFPVVIAIHLTTRKPLAEAWRELNTWTLPYYLVGAIAAGSFTFLKQAMGWPVLLLMLPLVYLLYRHYQLHASRLESETRHARELATLHMRSIEALAMAIEAKGSNSHDHLERVQSFALDLAQALRLDNAQTEALRAASLLHDIGELAVPDHIIAKSGKLTRDEYERLKIHPLVGAEIVERVKFPYPVVPIVRHHHEKWNGGGYPDGLRGEAIPVGARVLAVADAFEALISPREYRPALTLEEAVDTIRKESGILFDPTVVAALEKLAPSMIANAERRHRERNRTSTTDTPPVVPANAGSPAPISERRRDSFLSSIAGARQEAQALFELAQELGNSLSLDETLSVFAVRLRKTVPYDSISVFVRRDGVLRPEYVQGENVRTFAKLEIPVGKGISGWVAELRKPVVNGDPWMEPGYKEETGRSLPLKAVLSIPLEGTAGVVGVLSLYRAEKDSFSRDHLRVLQAISSKVALSIENALKYRQAESSASTDYLTGLYNARSLFLHLDSELARCRRLESPLAVLVSDLDGFKQVNDRFGHLEGNKLLQRVAHKLKESCREYDCVARMGGDEFVLVLPGLTADAVKAMLPRLRDTVKSAGKEVLQEDVIGFSVGEAYFPADGNDAEQLLGEADRRMYQVKARGKLLKEHRTGFDFDSKQTPV